jgi:hypothetical protein
MNDVPDLEDMSATIRRSHKPIVKENKPVLKENKPANSGLKKGFFDAKPNKPKDTLITKSKASSPKEPMTTITYKNPLIINEVQEVMKDEKLNFNKQSKLQIVSMM